MNGWLGEVQALQTSLNAARAKLAAMNRRRDRQPAGPVNLNMPVITAPPKEKLRAILMAGSK